MNFKYILLHKLKYQNHTMENKVITTPNPNFIPNIDCVLTRGDQFIKHTTLKFRIKEFADFLKEIADQDWEPMKVGHQSKMKDNPAIRSSKMNRNIYTSFTSNRYSSQEMKLFYINHKSCYVVDNDLIKFDTTSLVNGISNFKIIRYDKGDHFDEFHYDTVHTDSIAKTIGTALLFPPADISPFTGGDLVFKIEDGDQVSLQTIHPSKFTDWTLITFGHLLHKCTPVLSGTRYVFKAEIWSMYPDIMKPVELTLENITSIIVEKQSNKNELLQKSRHDIADLYSKYLDDIRVKLEARQRTILEETGPECKTLVLSNNKLSDIHYKEQCILMDNDMEDKIARKRATNDNCKEASLLSNYENTMHMKLTILKMNYNNLVIFLNDDNDIYLDVENILSTQNFSTQSITLKHNGKKEHDYYNNFENDTEFNTELKTVFVLSSFYEEPYDFNTFDIKHLKLLRQIINSDYKFTLFNRRYEISVPVLNDWDDYSRLDTKISIGIDKKNFNWIFEYPSYPGIMLNKESEYNDEGGCDDTFTFESTCILIWHD